MRYTRQVRSREGWNEKLANIHHLVGNLGQIFTPFAGNLGRVDFINDYEYDLFIRPDTCNPRYRLGLFYSPPWLLIHRFWFNFSVDNVHVDQRIIFNIVNLSKTRNLFTLGLTPIVRSSSRPKWWKSILSILSISYSTLIMWSSRQRIPETNVYYYKSPEHRFEKQELLTNMSPINLSQYYTV